MTQNFEFFKFSVAPVVVGSHCDPSTTQSLDIFVFNCTRHTRIPLGSQSELATTTRVQVKFFLVSENQVSLLLPPISMVANCGTGSKYNSKQRFF